MFELKLAGIGSAIDARADGVISNRLRDKLKWDFERERVRLFTHGKRPDERPRLSKCGADVPAHEAATA
jgi:hypothetical protein